MPDENVLIPPSSDVYSRIALELFDRSRFAFAPYYNTLQRRYDMYRGTYKTRGQPGWNNINVPLLFSVVQSDVARKAQVLFGGSPLLAFLPTGPEDAEKAARVERLIDIQLAQARTYEKATRFLINADLFGVSVWKYAWDGVRISPDWEFVDQTNFFPFPGMQDIALMPGVVHRFYKEYDDCVRDSEPSEEGTAPIYDAGAVRDLGGSAPHLPDDEAARKHDPATGGGETYMSRVSFSKLVEILEYWGRVPREYALIGADGKPTTEVIITVADRHVLLRAVANPHGAKPFGKYAPFEDPYFFYAPGKVEIGEKLQAAVNRLANTRLDALDLFISPPWLYNENSGLNPRRLVTGPGACIGVNGSVAETELKQLVPDLRGLQGAFVEGEQLWRWMQQSTGIIEDIAQGMGSSQSDRQTAREFVGRQEAVSTRLALESRLAEVQWLEPLGNAFAMMDRRFLPLDKQIKLIGASAVWDPVAERFVPPEPLALGATDLDADYDVKATGATRTLGKQAKVMNLQAAMGVLAVNPQIAATVNWRLFVRQFLALLDVYNADQIMNTEPQMMEALAIGQLLNAKAGPMAAPAPVVENALPPLGAQNGSSS